uniref:Uncharacterized protein n=1 Tax=Anguilla anguilla TaxID=7936 RepID=A0A0E9UM94_ANGAN
MDQLTIGWLAGECWFGQLKPVRSVNHTSQASFTRLGWFKLEFSAEVSF